MSSPAHTFDLAPHLERCFLFDSQEASYEIKRIQGDLPAWIRGSFYLNGPARFRRGELLYRHWLDGDGMVCALHFSGSVQFVSRFVRTRKFVDEEAAGRPLYRCFGTRFPGDRLRRGLMLEPPVNVSVYSYAGKVLAFGEQSLPYALDPVSLDTLGEFDFNGRLTEVSPFSAHPKIHPDSGHLFNFGIAFSPAQPSANVYEFGTSAQLIRRRRIPVPYQHSNHDFGITRRFVVFYLSPLIMDFEKFWRDGLTLMEALSWEPEKGSRILIVPWAVEGSPVEVPVGSGKCLHLINAFEEEDQIVVDVMELEAPAYTEYEVIPDLFTDISPCRPVRYRIDTATGRLLGRTAMEYDRSPDFPSLDRRLVGCRYTHFWMLGMSESGKPGRKFFNQLAHGDWNTGQVTDVFQTPPGVYLAGEPVFAGKPGADPESEGVLILERLMADEDRAEIVVFDALDVAQGPVAVLPLKHTVHPGFHGSFVPSN